MFALEVNNLTKVFKSRRFGKTTSVKALNKINFTINKGEIFGILGPNGAGKTTLINIISTLLLPDSGEVRVFGCDLVKEADYVRQITGTVSSKNEVYWRLSGWDNLLFYGRIYGMDDKEIKKRGDKLLDLVGLSVKKNVRTENYSTGMLKRFSLARVLLPDPKILLFDEPTTGLDAAYAKRFREVMKELKEKGKTIIITTHNLWEAELLCDRVAIIDDGSLLAVDTVEGLRKKIQRKKVVKIKPSRAISRKELERIKGVGAISDDKLENTRNVIFNEEVGNIKSLVALIRSHGDRIESFSFAKPSLEDIFIELTGGKNA